MSNQAVYVSGTHSPSLFIPPGLVRMALIADNWNGASAALEEAMEDVAAQYQPSLDPHTGEAVARTTNGPMFLLYGGCHFRLAVTGAPTNLRLVYQHAD